MLLELLAAASLSPNMEMLPSKTQKSERVRLEQMMKTNQSSAPVKFENVDYTWEIRLPDKNNTGYKTYDSVITVFTHKAQDTVREVKERSLVDGQFLKWVILPAKQIEKQRRGKSHLDSIYEQAGTLEMRKTTINRPLVVLGIGGSKHTAEFLLNMTGKDKRNKVYFYSDIDPVSYYNFMKETGVGVENLNFLVVSKSGTTFETKDAFSRFENALVKYYESKGLEPDAAVKKAQMHFAICTDANASSTNLRGKIGDKNGDGNAYIKELYIHDDVGGRYSMFDDAGLFVLAYSGVDKSVTERILKGATAASEKNLYFINLNHNPGIQGAIFNVFSRMTGFKMTQQQYFGNLFEGAGENWAKQLYLESLKDFDFAIGKAPDSMHYATEGHFSPQNRDKYNTIMTVMTPSISENYKRYLGAIAATYAETTPLKIETLAVENNAIKPEAIGEYIQSKHFETIFTGVLMRKMNEVESPAVYPEVLQPSVETYKNKFKPGSPFELSPGK